MSETRTSIDKNHYTHTALHIGRHLYHYCSISAALGMFGILYLHAFYVLCLVSLKWSCGSPKVGVEQKWLEMCDQGPRETGTGASHRLSGGPLEYIFTCGAIHVKLSQRG